jgi:hypothetical protein
MFTESVGWALTNVDNRNLLLHTTDGGNTWTDVTPSELPVANTFFLDSQSAWNFDDGNPGSGLVHTIDGGRTWSVVAESLPNEFSYGRVKFINEKNGWIETVNPGAGHAYIGIYMTKDGGRSWTLVPLTAPPDQVDMTDADFPGELHICLACGETFYYDPNRLIIIYGDNIVDQPLSGSGSLRLSLSMDLGKTWKNQQYTLPSLLVADGSVYSMPPVFFNTIDGFLPFGLIKFNPDGTHAYDRLAVYTTHDGGLSWIPNHALFETNTLFGNNDMTSNMIDFISTLDAFVTCGNDLCTTHNGAQTWQTLKSNLSFAYTDKIEYVEQIDFVSSEAGWAITSEGTVSFLYRTTDGGMTWTKVASVFAP